MARGDRVIVMDAQTAARLEQLLRELPRNEARREAGAAARQQPIVLAYKAVITEHAEHPTAEDRYLYGHQELKKHPLSPGWTTLAGGRSGTVSLNAAQNLAEGVYPGGYLASGVKRSTLPSTFKQPPVPVGSVVTMEIHQTPDGSPEYWFERGVVPDGECP